MSKVIAKTLQTASLGGPSIEVLKNSEDRCARENGYGLRSIIETS